MKAFTREENDRRLLQKATKYTSTAQYQKEEVAGLTLADSPEFTDVKITLLGAEVGLGNIPKSVKSYLQKLWLVVTDIADGGGTTSINKARNLTGGNATTLKGSIPYQIALDDTVMLDPNTTTTKKFLSETGTGTNGDAPAWATIAAADVPTLNQNTTGTAGGLSGTPTAPTIKVGDATNNFEVTSDGTVKLNGTATVTVDLVGAISGVRVAGVGATVNGVEQTVEFTATSNLADYSWTSFQMNHAWKAGSVVQPHIHWEQNSAAIPNWLMQYRWRKNGQAKVTAWTNYKCNTLAFTYVSGTLDQIAHGAGITPPSGYGLSDIIQARVIRDNANASTLFAGVDVYSGIASMTSNDCHIELDALGSATEFTK